MRFYYSTTKMLGSNLLGIFIGLASALIINLITNESSNLYNCTIILSSLVILLLIKLVNLNEKFHKRYHINIKDSIPSSSPSQKDKKINDNAIENVVTKVEYLKSDSEQWECAINDKRCWKYYYLSSIILIIVLITIIPSEINNVNEKIKEEDTQKEMLIHKQYFTLHDSVQMLKVNMNVQFEEIRKLNDSIISIISINKTLSSTKN